MSTTRSWPHEEIALNEILISPPQDQPESGSKEETVEFASSHQGLLALVETVASKSGSQEETVEIVSSPQDKAEVPTDSEPNEIVRDTAASENWWMEETEDSVFPPQLWMTDDEIKAKELFEEFDKAALKGDRKTARQIYKGYEKLLKFDISPNGDTPLHIAVASHSSIFVQILIERMPSRRLKIRNGAGNTAFCIAAASGKMENAQAMLRRASDLLKITGENNRLPIEMAAMTGHKQMVEFLYDEMKSADLIEEFHSRLMVHPLIKTVSSENLRKVELIKELYRAALKDDWNTARDIFERHPHFITASISEQWDTPLHITAVTESSNFLLNLVEKMNSEDLARRNKAGNTAFCLIAASGNLEVAKAMLKKNSDLLLIPGESRMLPFRRAAQSGHKEMVKFLYNETKNKLIDEDDLKYMFYDLISAGFHDIALELDLLKDNLELGFNRKLLYILAKTPITFSSCSNQNHLEGILRRCFNRISISNMFCHKKPKSQALELLKILLEKVNLGALWISEVISDAAACGNIEFLKLVIRDYPALILKPNQDNYSIFHVAVLNRQKDIFKLIHEISPSYKEKILKQKDRVGNNILHLAGMLASGDRLNTVSGVALQLQEEFMWFEEVSKIVPTSYAKAKNKAHQTPRALFTETHVDLKEKGEKWMKDTVNSCMIVATLIATVVFAATFTVPGGIKEDTGSPNFLREVSFVTFVISDAISLVASSSSILTFLSIFTSGYAQEDFRLVLPRKLVLGLSTLFLSITAMMVVFCSTVFIVFKDGMIWIPILISIIASLPVILFIKQQRRLLFEAAHLTFKLSSLSKE